jgi:hypothetical protein
VQVLKEKLRHVARAAERAEEGRKQQGRIYKSELKRAQDGERDKAAEIERLRWELDQLGEREASRSKVNLLQDEVRNFKTASQHKLQQMELQQVREREASQAKRLRELEDEIRGLRGTGEKKVGEVEAQRAREMETHERRIVKLMAVLEALTSAGDERTDLAALAEKMNHLREVCVVVCVQLMSVIALVECRLDGLPHQPSECDRVRLRWRPRLHSSTGARSSRRGEGDGARLP